jgi:hypothetical protein
MRVFDPLNSESDQLGLRDELAATAGKGLMDWAQFANTESHGIPRDGLNEKSTARWG